MPLPNPVIGSEPWGGVLNARLDDLQAQININPANGSWIPSDQGYLSWTMDPISAASDQVLATGVMTLMRVAVRAQAAATVTVNNIEIGVNVAGITLTAGQNFVALYNAAGTRLGVSADQSASWVSVGHKTIALAAPAIVPAGLYWIGVLSNGATPIRLTRATIVPAASANSKTTAATTRFGTFGAGLTATPASFTPASITPGLPAYFGGLS